MKIGQRERQNLTYSEFDEIVRLHARRRFCRQPFTGLPRHMMLYVFCCLKPVITFGKMFVHASIRKQNVCKVRNTNIM